MNDAEQVSTTAREVTNPEDPVQLGGSALPSPDPNAPIFIVPISLTKANEMVFGKHRHNGPLRSFFTFAVGLADDKGILRGAAIVGHPSTRKYEDGATLEVRRVVTDGVRNGNSKLYGACASVSRALGYRRLITYTLPSESGASLRATNWHLDGLTEPPHWQEHGSHAPADVLEDLRRNPHSSAAARDGIAYPVGPKNRWILSL